MTVSIRNSQGRGRNPYKIDVWRLHYDEERKRFAVDDFRYDQWDKNECPEELEPISIKMGVESMSIIFDKDVDALKLINWLRIEGVAATNRIQQMPG